VTKSGIKVEYPSISLVGTTEFIAQEFTNLRAKEFYARTAHFLSSVKPLEVFASWAEKKYGNKLVGEPQNIVLLWNRFSGQNVLKGYNPEGDSDPRGQEQIIQIARKHKFKVLIVGHACNWTQEAPKELPDLHLGEFWNDDTVPFPDPSRAGQTSFFIYLLKHHNVVQIGQKTGGMDAAALIGTPTVYIEDDGSFSIFRMQKWANCMPLYQRAAVSLPPTRLGKSIRQGKSIDVCTAGYVDSDQTIIEKALVQMFELAYKIKKT
jgi:hypothetical protein